MYQAFGVNVPTVATRQQIVFELTPYVILGVQYVSFALLQVHLVSKISVLVSEKFRPIGLPLLPPSPPHGYQMGRTLSVIVILLCPN